MDSLVLQTAIGLVFIFGITAAAVSAVTEGVSRFLGRVLAHLPGSVARDQSASRNDSSGVSSVTSIWAFCSRPE